MRFLILMLCMFYETQAFTQILENFSDGDLTTNPEWIGDTSQFQVNNFKLQSQGPATSSVLHLATEYIFLDTMEYVFTVQLDFNPSSSNFVRVYLISDSANLEADLNGYFIQFGETSSSADSLDLYLQQGSLVSKLFTAPWPCMTSTSSNSVVVRMIKKGTTWQVTADCNGSGFMFPPGEFTDTSVQSGKYFGFYCKYSTASRSDKYYFDDIRIGLPEIDTVRPSLLAADIVSMDSIVLLFSEPLDSSSIQDEAVFVNNSSDLESSFSSMGRDKIILKLMTPLVNGSINSLQINGISDLAGNKFDTVFNFEFFRAGPFDVVISEIFPDPLPSLGMPLVEYIELYNCSNWGIELHGWSLSDYGKKAILPHFKLEAKDRVVLTTQDSAALFDQFGHVIGLDDWPSLNNVGDQLILRSNLGELIHHISYHSSWHDDGKRNGGFSLEMIDPGNPCGESENWGSSQNETGGTPCEINSINAFNPDRTNPELIRTKFYDSITIGLLFSEQLDSSDSVLDPANISFEDKHVLAIWFADQSRKEIIIKLSSAMTKGKKYAVSAGGVTDCIGLDVLISDHAITGIPEEAEKEDFVINEILFNPESGGVDFLELYNKSDKIIDLKGFFVFEVDPESSALLEFTELKIGSYLLLPGEYVALTSDRNKILEYHEPKQRFKIVEVDGFPNFDDDQGCVYITKAGSIPIDKLNYYKDWHTPLLVDLNGVSLERINPNDSSSNPFNWQSASAAEGFATPASQNSHFSNGDSAELKISFQTRIFSPDDDGIDDILLFNVNNEGKGAYLSLIVLSHTGIPVKHLLHNYWIGQSSGFKWDGADDEGRKLPIGIYILMFEWFDENSKKTNRQFEEIVLAGEIN